MAGSINSIPVQEMPPRDWLEYIRNKYLPEKPFIVAESHLEEFLSHLPSSAREDARRVWVRRHGKSIYAVLDELMDSYLREGSLGFKQEEAKIVQESNGDVHKFINKWGSGGVSYIFMDVPSAR